MFTIGISSASWPYIWCFNSCNFIVVVYFFFARMKWPLKLKLFSALGRPFNGSDAQWNVRLRYTDNQNWFWRRYFSSDDSLIAFYFLLVHLLDKIIASLLAPTAAWDENKTYRQKVHPTIWPPTIMLCYCRWGCRWTSTRQRCCRYRCTPYCRGLPLGARRSLFVCRSTNDNAAAVVA